MNKITDKDTIKGFCNKKLCPLAREIINRQQRQLDNYSHNVRNMSKDFIEQYKIIQEQQAEIKRLKEEVASKTLKCSLIEREKAEDILDFVGELKLARAEAVKEFIEKLKATPMRFSVEYVEYYDKPPIKKMVLFIDDNDLDNLANL